LPFLPAHLLNFFSVRIFFCLILAKERGKAQNICRKISGNRLVKLCESRKEAKIAFTLSSDVMTRNLIAVAIIEGSLLSLDLPRDAKRNTNRRRLFVWPLP